MVSCEIPVVPHEIPVVLSISIVQASNSQLALNVTFADVGGLKQQIADLRRYVYFRMKVPEEIKSAGTNYLHVVSLSVGSSVRLSDCLTVYLSV